MPGWHDLLGSYNEHATINPGNVWLIEELVNRLCRLSCYASDEKGIFSCLSKL